MMLEFESSLKTKEDEIHRKFPIEHICELRNDDDMLRYLELAEFWGLFKHTSNHPVVWEVITTRNAKKNSIDYKLIERMLNIADNIEHPLIGEIIEWPNTNVYHIFDIFKFYDMGNVMKSGYGDYILEVMHDKMENHCTSISKKCLVI